MGFFPWQGIAYRSRTGSGHCLHNHGHGTRGEWPEILTDDRTRYSSKPGIGNFRAN